MDNDFLLIPIIKSTLPVFFIDNWLQIIYDTKNSLFKILKYWKTKLSLFKINTFNQNCF